MTFLYCFLSDDRLNIKICLVSYLCVPTQRQEKVLLVTMTTSLVGSVTQKALNLLPILVRWAPPRKV